MGILPCSMMFELSSKMKMNAILKHCTICWWKQNRQYQSGINFLQCNFFNKPNNMKEMDGFESFKFHQRRSISYCFSQKNSRAKVEPEDADAICKTRHDIDNLFDEIRKELSSRETISNIATYYFDGKGKSIRPLIALLMAKAVNVHQQNNSRLHKSQKEIAKITEMIHTSSLLHDDVVDGADTRRGKPTVHSIFSHRKAVLAGDFILSIAATMLARIQHEHVTNLLSQVLVDLVQGEFMQLNSDENEDDRFTHYLQKTYNKTASLIALSCKAMAAVTGANNKIQETCYLYGKHVGIAFQLVDDMLDFTCDMNSLGKPNLNDLKSGLATAPVLFACDKFPELNAMVKRRFQGECDVNKALTFVLDSDGLEKTKFLAYKHCQQAIMHISVLKKSPEQRSLILLTDNIINRRK